MLFSKFIKGIYYYYECNIVVFVLNNNVLIDYCFI